MTEPTSRWDAWAFGLPGDARDRIDPYIRVTEQRATATGWITDLDTQIAATGPVDAITTFLAGPDPRDRTATIGLLEHVCGIKDAPLPSPATAGALTALEYEHLQCRTAADEPVAAAIAGLRRGHPLSQARHWSGHAPTTVHNWITRALHRAGYPNATPEAIRRTGALEIYQQDGIVAAAVHLGMRSPSAARRYLQAA